MAKLRKEAIETPTDKKWQAGELGFEGTSPAMTMKSALSSAAFARDC
jgi:hypothetical protein